MNAAPTRPFDAGTARRIARAFLPDAAFGNRYHYYYTLAKLRSDPLYPGVLHALRGSDAPLLDLGCGLGLLAHALRDDGQAMPYRGVDHDAGKIARATRCAAQAGLADVHFDIVELAQAPPPHAGSVALLDVLHYLAAEAQVALLGHAIAMLAPGAVLVIRTGLGDDSRRARASFFADRMANLIGWMQPSPKHYPSRDALQRQLQAAGLAASFEPLYGRTPFNNWLVVATR